jgi:hypothetical protein
VIVKGVEILSWAAWSPGIESQQAWREWAHAPCPLEREGTPDVTFLPALQRRRCDPLSRMALRVAHDACPASSLREVTAVFASRHGSFGTMASLLDDLARECPMSPTRFSHSVHNTQAGLFSIWAKNQNSSTCVAAGRDTFAHGFLEALSSLRRYPERPALLVMGDEAVPEPFTQIADHDHGAYAVALLLAAPREEAGESESVHFELRSHDPDEPAPGPPQALCFVRWLVGSEPCLEIASGHHTWVWRRQGSSPRAVPGR